MLLVYKFDNGDSYNVEDKNICDYKGMVIANIKDTIEALSLDEKSLTDTQLWCLCKPIILAHEKGVVWTKEEIGRKILGFLA